MTFRGKLTPNAPLAPLIWFKSGGAAEKLFEPADVADLQAFLAATPLEVSVWPLGLGSNLIIRDGGMPGVTVRLGKAFAGISVFENPHRDGRSLPGGLPPATHQAESVPGRTIRCGAGAPGISVASAARDAGIAGLEFLRGIPGTIGGAVRMNAGAYGREVQNVLVSADVILRTGEARTLLLRDMGYTYRHSMLPREAIVVAATFVGTPGDPTTIGAEMDRIAAEREASQPLRSKTGGSTFKNPEGHKAWALVDAAGCRGLTIGGAQVSEKHCNFLLNLGDATSADIEALGEEVRKRVLAHSGVELEWEIQRVGQA
ncbi:MAG: UDP-N-acetylmuramate dehydrogenase [Sphingomonadaceae bacterium]